MLNEEEINIYKCLSEFRKPLITEIIRAAGIAHGSKGLDAGCGIGEMTGMLASAVRETGHISGLDLSHEFIDYAKKNNAADGISYFEGDINSLPFGDSIFDWVWSMDTLWPGPEEYGCPAREPVPVLREYHRVLKPGGSVFLLFWTSQKLLPGYPLLEARLNTLASATAPFVSEMDPLCHVMNASQWLYKAGFNNISSATFTGNITAPLTGNEKDALKILSDMLWNNPENQIGEPDLELFKRLTDKNSRDYIPDNQYYTGFYTYTVFSGRK